MSDSQEERKFLNNLASPLATALFVLDVILDEVQIKRRRNGK